MMRVQSLIAAMLGIVVSGVAGCGRAARETYVVPEVLDIEVVGEHFRWEVRYPGPDGVLGTADDRIGARDVHVPIGTHARVHLRSRDYIYTFALPHLALKEIAVPELEYALEFDTGETGRHELRGDQMCGYTHPELLGTLIVEPRAAFVRTMQSLVH